MLPLMLQCNPYQGNTARAQCVNQCLNCFGNCSNNLLARPQQLPPSAGFPGASPQAQAGPKGEKKSGKRADRQKGDRSGKQGRRKQFSREEDRQLLELVGKYGEENWKQVSRRMPNRSTRQCHERYKYFLSPKLSNHPWTSEECAILDLKYRELGPRWAEIALFLNNRSAVSVKNKWSALERKKKLRAMLPLLSELYLANHRVVKGINIRKYQIKTKRDSQLAFEQNVKAENSPQEESESCQEDGFDTLSNLFNECSDEQTEDSYEAFFSENDFENYDENLFTIFD